MDPHHTLRVLFAYYDWARDKLMTLAAPLSDEQLDRPFEMGPGTLRNTLRHLYGAERFWFEKWHARELPEFPHQRELAALDDLWQVFRGIADARNAYFDGLTDDDLRRRVTYSFDGERTHATPLGDLMLHVANHGIHHRAQALNMLRRLDVKVPGLDYLFWKIERPTVEHDAALRDKLRETGLEPGERVSPPDDLDVQTIRKYFRYCDWARDRVHALAEPLGAAQLDRAFEIGIGTLRKTLLHIRDAEQWWLENWISVRSAEFKQLPETTPVAELKALFRETANQRDAHMDTLANDDLKRVASADVRPGVTLSFRLGETMLQLCGHGVHHRAQALNMLRHSGVGVPELDYEEWIRKFA